MNALFMGVLFLGSFSAFAAPSVYCNASIFKHDEQGRADFETVEIIHGTIELIKDSRNSGGFKDLYLAQLKLNSGDARFDITSIAGLSKKNPNLSGIKVSITDNKKAVNTAFHSRGNKERVHFSYSEDYLRNKKPESTSIEGFCKFNL